MPTEANLRPADLTVVILAGGLGTRLRPVISDRPKVLAPAGGRPFLSWWLDVLDAQGFRDAVLCTGYMAEQVSKTFGPTHGRLKLRYSVEEQPLGTGGALRHALPLLKSETALVLNGDSFCDVDLAAFGRTHGQCGLHASLVLTRVEDISRFGAVQFQSSGRVEAFREKTGRAEPGWINAGTYLFSRELLAALPDKQTLSMNLGALASRRRGPTTPPPARRRRSQDGFRDPTRENLRGILSLERDLLPRWVPEGINSFRCTGKFIDIGTPESLAQAEDFFLGLKLAAA